MNSFVFAIILSSIAGFSTILGSFIVFIPSKKEIIIPLSLTFSAAIMIGLSIFELIPEFFFYNIKVHNIYSSIFIIVLFFIISYYLIKLLNKYITNQNDLYRLGILNMIILILHNLPEGIITFISSYHDINLGIKLSIAIILHNIPEGIAIAMPIYYSKHSFKDSFIATAISGLAEPFGALLAFILLKNYISDSLINYILLFVGAMMITLAIEELLPKAISFNNKKYSIIGFTIGIFIIILNILFFK